MGDGNLPQRRRGRESQPVLRPGQGEQRPLAPHGVRELREQSKWDPGRVRGYSARELTQGVFHRKAPRRARCDCTCADAKPPATAACQKELAEPTLTKFRTEIPRTPMERGEEGGKHPVVAVKAKEREEHGSSPRDGLNISILGLVRETHCLP